MKKIWFLFPLLCLVFFPIGITKAQQTLPEKWVVQKIHKKYNPYVFTLVSQDVGWVIKAQCQQPKVDPPPVGTVCILREDSVTMDCGEGYQIIKIIQIESTPTIQPSLTATITPTTTPSPTPTNTPTITPTYTPFAPTPLPTITPLPFPTPLAIQRPEKNANGLSFKKIILVMIPAACGAYIIYRRRQIPGNPPN